jgi:hypothetical protein
MRDCCVNCCPTFPHPERIDKCYDVLNSATMIIVQSDSEPDFQLPNGPQDLHQLRISVDPKRSNILYGRPQSITS